MKAKSTHPCFRNFFYGARGLAKLFALFLFLLTFPGSSWAQLSQKRSSATGHLKEDSYTVFPNPSPGKFFVVMKDLEPPYDVNVYNLIGEMVYHWESQAGGTASIEVNLSKQPRGVYFVELDTDKGNMIKKIIIDHEKD